MVGRGLLIAAGGLLVTGAFAKAADLPPAPAPLPPLAGDFSGGFYVRADGGVGFNQRPHLSIFPDPVGLPAVSLADPNYRGNYTSSTFPDARLSDTGFVDLGIGYQFGRWFRFDVTGEYRGGARLSATNVLNDSGTTPTPFGPLNESNSALTNFRGHLDSLVALANGYVDLGNYYGFTPFIGAGVGAARNRLYGLSETGIYSITVGANPPLNVPTAGFTPNRSKTSVAWALMAGVGYDITPSLKLEVGYRRLDLGRFESGGENLVLANGTIVPTGFSGRGRDFVSNDIRVGLRWRFGTAAPDSPPIVRNY